MQLRIASLVTAALTTTALADSLIVYQYCFTLACVDNGVFTTSYGSYNIDAGDGYRSPDVPGMASLCVDQANARLHFYFNGQSKRCMVQTDLDFQTCSDDFKFARCSTIYYGEVPCTW